ncbi:GT-D fold domain-containing glycosyltransferase [Flavobacterium sp. GSA192]|uniref:GT-D fold domain-containing glycosyltransferase n=1 Tax=Flavobacterium sp. GSA192 TaxID=2576304 RepID=UPI00112E62E7|nr:GT-D fold domain-containing glycosyltransferase [Flavobacterium sp. GSA192]
MVGEKHIDLRKSIIKLKRKSILFVDKLHFSVIKNRLRYLFEIEFIKKISENCRIVSPEQTLNELQYAIQNNNRGIYLRFGDGDVFLLNNQSDAYQEKSVLLADEMKECFSLNDEGIFKCLAIHSEMYGYSKEMVIGNHKNKDGFAFNLFKNCYEYFSGCKIYSPVALHFISTINPVRANEFLKILKSKTTVFIGNENVRNSTIELLFGSKAKHIKTPSKNAYSEIDSIEKEVLNEIDDKTDFFVMCVAMGCSGRPLMKRLWMKSLNKNFFLFDFGSLLDGIEGNNSRTWLKMNQINYQQLLNGLNIIE